VSVDGWDGRGLPPVAHARTARAAASAVRTSLLPADGVAGLAAAGFDVVGEVLGTAVMHIGLLDDVGCRYRPYAGTDVPTPTLRDGYEPYLRAARHGRDTALNRLLQEAAALGADGVVGVRFTEEFLEGGKREIAVGDKREFMALGTAVRSRGRARPARPFTTDLGGQDLAKLLAAGWVPVGLAYGIGVAINHDTSYIDSLTQSTLSQEMTDYSHLITRVRTRARRDFTEVAARLGGDAALLSGLRSHAWRVTVGSEHYDHVAECVVTGNAIARFHTGRKATTSSLTVLPLRSTR
jgi:uncharacterized protein YbjQ (UPF0145 family)